MDSTIKNLGHISAKSNKKEETMTDEIKVHVVDYGAGRNLMMRYRDPFTRQAHRQDDRHAKQNASRAGRGEVGSGIAGGPLQGAMPNDLGGLPREV